MSLIAASINVDGTVATTGGTATTFLSLGDSLSQHILLLDNSAAFIDQTTFEFSTKSPKVSASAPAGYTQKRATCLIRVPLALDNGKYTVNTWRIEQACDPETTDAEIDSGRVLCAQAIHDSDFQDFWRRLSVT